jgi:predicted nucleic acid-binding protein
LTTHLVLDSWLLLAWLKDQAPGADRMEELWQRAATQNVRLSACMVNIGEVFYLTARYKGLAAAEELLEHLRNRPLQMIAASDALVIEAARLKAAYPISYADAFAAATAMRARCPLATGDPEFRALEKDGIIRLDWAG